MPTVSGDAAIAWMRAKGTNVPGSCLNTVWQAYGSHPSVGAHAGGYPDAIEGWTYATKRHPGDANPPAGFPVWFGVSPTRTDANASAGDVVISLGGGQVIATDANGIGGRIGVTTIAARAAIIQRPYLGWTEDFLGYDVVTTSAASSGSTLLEDFLGALSDSEQREVLNGVRNLYAGFFAGGPSMADGKRSLVQSVADLRALLNQVIATQGRKVTRSAASQATILTDTPVAIDPLQDGADTNSLARKIDATLSALEGKLAASGAGGSAIDYDALAAAIVKIGGTAPTPEAIGQVVAAELAKLHLSIA